MKKIVLKNGLYGSLLLVGIPFLFWLALPGEQNYGLGEVIGYSTMVLVMVFVHLGIKQYRDQELDGNISFGQALKVGLLIAALPSLAFGLYNLFYINFLDPEFFESYYAYSQANLKESLSGAEYELAVQKMEAEKELWQDPSVQFFVMFLTVFLIGLVVTIISSIILGRKKQSKLAS